MYARKAYTTFEAKLVRNDWLFRKQKTTIPIHYLRVNHRLLLGNGQKLQIKLLLSAKTGKQNDVTFTCKMEPVYVASMFSHVPYGEILCKAQ